MISAAPATRAHFDALLNQFMVLFHDAFSGLVKFRELINLDAKS